MQRAVEMPPFLQPFLNSCFDSYFSVSAISLTSASLSVSVMFHVSAVSVGYPL